MCEDAEKSSEQCWGATNDQNYSHEKLRLRLQHYVLVGYLDVPRKVSVASLLKINIRG